MTDTTIDRSVKIYGTNHDRRRKLSVEDVTKIRTLHAKGWPINDLAYAFGVAKRTIKYHVDEEYKHQCNKLRNMYPTIQHPKEQFDNRVAYKRTLINQMV